MIESLINIDKEFFIFLNGLNAPWLDPFFYWITKTWLWVPLYVFVIFLIIRKWKTKSVIVLVALVLSIVLTDQTCNLLKRTVVRPRPNRDPVLSLNAHYVPDSDGTVYKGGTFSFPSAHAANSTVFAVFVSFFFGKKRKWVRVSMIAWVLALSYSRIYLSFHYPLDLLAGWLLGATCAFVVIKFLLLFFGKKLLLSNDSQ